eukprot:g7465.t1
MDELRYQDFVHHLLRGKAARAPFCTQLVRRMGLIFDGPHLRVWRGSSERALRDRFSFAAAGGGSSCNIPAAREGTEPSLAKPVEQNKLGPFPFWQASNIRSCPLKQCVAEISDVVEDEKEKPNSSSQGSSSRSGAARAHVRAPLDYLSARCAFLEREVRRCREDRLILCNPRRRSPEYLALQQLSAQLDSEKAQLARTREKLDEKEQALLEVVAEDGGIIIISSRAPSSTSTNQDAKLRGVRELLLEVADWEEKLGETMRKLWQLQDPYTAAEKEFGTILEERDRFYADMEQELAEELRGLAKLCVEQAKKQPAPHSHLRDKEHLLLIAEKGKLLSSIYDTVEQVREDYRQHFLTLKEKREEHDALVKLGAKLKERDILIRECVALERKDFAANHPAPPAAPAKNKPMLGKEGAAVSPMKQTNAAGRGAGKEVEGKNSK